MASPILPAPMEEGGHGLVGRVSVAPVDRSVLKTICLCVKIIIMQIYTFFRRYEPKDFIVQTDRESCYIDMGELYGSWVIGNAMSWWPLPVHIEQKKVDAFLGQIFDQLNKDGVTKVNLAFAQISDIDHLVDKSAGSPNDTITPIFTDGYSVGKTGQDFLMYFNEKARRAHIDVDLSFGGANATPADMKVVGNPDNQAKKLAGFMQTYGIAAVDFDIEGATVDSVGNDPNALAFFRALHTELHPEKKRGEIGGETRAVITLAGSLQNGPMGPLKTVFANFDSCFDRVNLMLYSNTQYYLDANNQTWGISQWLQQVGGDPSKISIGFYDKIPYENSDASAGEPYPIPEGLTRGQAAAWVYQRVCADLGRMPGDFAPAFWWTDDPMDLPDDKVIEDFHTFLGIRAKKEGDNPVYDQYLAYCQMVDNEIVALRGNPNYWPNQKAVEALISEIIAQKGQLAAIEQKDINGTLAKFQQDCASTLEWIQEYYQQALNIMNGSPEWKAIQQDLATAKGLVFGFTGAVQADGKQLSSLTQQQSTIQSSTIPELQEAIDKLTDPEKKAKAQTLLGVLSQQNGQLGTDISVATPAMTVLQNEAQAISQQGSIECKALLQLQQLASNPNPTEEDVKQANAALKSIQTDPAFLKAQNDLVVFQNDSVKTLNQDIGAVQVTIAAIEALLPGKRVEIYSDNWAIPDGHLPMPNIPKRAAINYAFGEPLMEWEFSGGTWQVVQQSEENGQWAANFAGGFPVDPSNIIGTLLPRMPDALAIGGWNTSQDVPGFDIHNPAQPYAYQENNLFQIMSSSEQGNRDAFRKSIVATVAKDGYKSVIMDYENYSHGHQEGSNYTEFLIALDKDLQALNPPVRLSIAVSPSVANQDYYDLTRLVRETGITFEPMCYDYALGISPQVVTPNAAVGQTFDYLRAMVAAGTSASRMKFGFSTYGVGFNLPYGTTLQQILQGMNQESGLPFSSYWSGDCPTGTGNGGNGQISNDQIFQLIGSSKQNPWQPTASGWQAISYYNPSKPDYPPEVFYFHPTAGNDGRPILISAQTASAVKAISTKTGEVETVTAAVVNLVREANTDPLLSGNLGFFGWDAMEDENSVTLSAVLEADATYRRNPPPSKSKPAMRPRLW